MHTHVQQTHNGVPVFGGEAIVHLNANNEEEAEAATDNLIAGVNVFTTPGLTADDAVGFGEGSVQSEEGLRRMPHGRPEGRPLGAPPRRS